MQQNGCTVTVFFDPPYWVAVLESRWDGLLSVCKLTFGAEPKDYEVYARLLEGWRSLSFSDPIATAPARVTATPNTKRMQRAIAKALQGQGVGTKAQQALTLQRETSKQRKKTAKAARREEDRQRQFEIRQQKKKAKQRGH